MNTKATGQMLPHYFYTRTNVVQVAKDLLGKVLVTHLDGKTTSGIIAETEAYDGPHDKASHAFGNRRTKRTEPMFARGGTAYVYLCYGFHYLFNVVTGVPDIPQAVLVRGLEPLDGIDAMLVRRGLEAVQPKLTAGPGSLAKALGITTALTGHTLSGPEVWIEDRGLVVKPESILAGTRVGVAYAAEDALLPYRFSISGNAFVSKGKGLIAA